MAAEIGERFLATSKVRAMIRAEIGTNNALLEQVIGEAVGEIARECERRCTAKFEAAMSEFAYRGQWVEGKQYRRGNFVTLGSVWHCNIDTGSKPGTDSTWTMAIAKPRDGRDAIVNNSAIINTSTNGTGGALPEPPQPRTVRSSR